MRTITIRFTEEEAMSMGLLACTCGWPKNNHFDFDEMPCAHDKSCKGYKEVARVGKIIKNKKKVKK